MFLITSYDVVCVRRCPDTERAQALELPRPPQNEVESHSQLCDLGLCPSSHRKVSTLSPA